MVQKIPLVEENFAYVPLDEKDTLVSWAIPLSADGENALEVRKNGLYVKSMSGPPGKSAYELWLSEGHTGTFNDYMNSLKGTPGKSAYELWLSEGHTGSLNDFLNSLKGKPGAPPEVKISRDASNIIRMHSNGLYATLHGRLPYSAPWQGTLSFDFPTNNQSSPGINVCGEIYGKIIYFTIRQNIYIPKGNRPYEDIVYVSAYMHTLPYNSQTKTLVPYMFTIDKNTAVLDKTLLNDSPILTYYFIVRLICFDRPDSYLLSSVWSGKPNNIETLMRGPYSQNSGLLDYPMATSISGAKELKFNYQYYFALLSS